MVIDVIDLARIIYEARRALWQAFPNHPLPPPWTEAHAFDIDSAVHTARRLVQGESLYADNTSDESQADMALTTAILIALKPYLPVLTPRPQVLGVQGIDAGAMLGDD